MYFVNVCKSATLRPKKTCIGITNVSENGEEQ